MQLTSPAFGNNKFIPSVYGCDGYDINPPLEISDVPETAVSLALIVNDPDAPGGSFIHWLLWNIDVGCLTIRENSVPEDATAGLNSSGEIGYTGPCPPENTHRYIFTLYALDTVLQLPDNTTKDELLAAMQGHIITQAELVGLYNRDTL